MYERSSVLTFQKEKQLSLNLLFVLAAALCTIFRLPYEARFPVFEKAAPIRPPSVNSSIGVRSILEQRLLLAGNGNRNGNGNSTTLEIPIQLGSLQPKGRINPDGSEVWGYPEGSALEDVIEVHVKDGRVVREVLRPSSRSSASEVAGAITNGR